MDSGLDALASLINLFAVRYALSPADAEHRFGHGKAEPLAALLQALLILGSCAYVFYEAITRLRAPQPIDAVLPAMGVMGFSIAATLALLALQRHVIRRTQSPAIRADSLHYQADLLTNSATLAALFLAGLGLPLADPLFGLAIGLWLLIAAREVLSESLDQLLDRELPDSEREAILAIVSTIAGPDTVCTMRTRRSGRIRHIQVHLAMDGAISLEVAHAIADAVKGGILARFAEADVLVLPGLAPSDHPVATQAP
jgi:ferrous-iron efflux pump FieF